MVKGKKNISISLPENLISDIEEHTDNGPFTNRSQAVEYILGMFLGKNPQFPDMIELSKRLENNHGQIVELIEKMNNVDDEVTESQPINEFEESEKTEEDEEFEFEEGSDEERIQRLYETMVENGSLNEIDELKEQFDEFKKDGSEHEAFRKVKSSYE